MFYVVLDFQNTFVRLHAYIPKVTENPKVTDKMYEIAYIFVICVFYP